MSLRRDSQPYYIWAQIFLKPSLICVLVSKCLLESRRSVWMLFWDHLIQREGIFTHVKGIHQGLMQWECVPMALGWRLSMLLQPCIIWCVTSYLCRRWCAARLQHSGTFPLSVQNSVKQFNFNFYSYRFSIKIFLDSILNYSNWKECLINWNH